MRIRLILFIEITILLTSAIFRFQSKTIYSYLEEYTALSSLISFSLFLIFIDFLRRILIYSYAKQKNLKYHEKDNFHFGINNIAKLLIGLGIVVTIFRFFGIDIRTLLTSLSIVAAAIAIISKEYINDFLIGLYFSFSNDFEINDYVQLGENKGKIIKLQMLKIKILNDDDDLVIIPNTKIYNNEIINYTKRDIRSMSIDFQIDIKSVGNIELFESELVNSLNDFNQFLEPNSFRLKIVDMKRDCIDFKFQYTLKNLDRELQREIRKKTVRHVYNHISKKIIPVKSEENSIPEDR